jgi:UDP-N-acetylglucosamine 2-epimerase (non-hydrolysing)
MSTYAHSSRPSRPGGSTQFYEGDPVLHALGKRPAIKQTLVHTGQHYDVNMSDVFFSQLEMPSPDVNLEVGSGSHVQQTAQIMSKFEPVLLERNPDVVLVYGDCQLRGGGRAGERKAGSSDRACRSGIAVVRLDDAGGINRVVTDRLTDLLFIPSEDGDINLLQEGISG